MKVGLLSDVHANLPALEAVLEDMPPVAEVVCAGDVVGYNPWPAECLARVREVSTATVRGNHDRTVETPERYRANLMAEAGLEHAKRELSSEGLTWLRSLPRATWFGDGRYHLVHSHPASEREDAYVYPGEFPALDRHLDALADDAPTDVEGDRDDIDGLVLGHTHVQGARSVDGRLVVNPGSVGQPRDGDPDAAYAVLDVDAGEVDLRRVAYDVDRVAEAVEREGLPTRTAERLYRGE
ncbi:metallophosphoesterase [Halorubrum sp. 48-1-W]|uniref:metallophosphoesterase family protein n=1 Tax=Halorubrum sp. 48-1-W TaxID=2249761 RepID=UPI000DCD672E|nr:metallophosphoesterase family protein [Halorubrum sp. 48-1-W]RAW45232.1 metallophosphoesterase [Halorubrum sp. 48-1-W]